MATAILCILCEIITIAATKVGDDDHDHNDDDDDTADDDGHDYDDNNRNGESTRNASGSSITDSNKNNAVCFVVLFCFAMITSYQREQQ